MHYITFFKLTEDATRGLKSLKETFTGEDARLKYQRVACHTKFLMFPEQLSWKRIMSSIKKNKDFEGFQIYGAGFINLSTRKCYGQLTTVMRSREEDTSIVFCEEPFYVREHYMGDIVHLDYMTVSCINGLNDFG